MEASPHRKKVSMKMQNFGAAVAAAAMIVTAATVLRGQELLAPVSPAQQAFEAGQYDQALKAIGEMRTKGSAGLPETFLAAHVLLRQDQKDKAKEEFEKLASGENPVMRLVGESSRALVDDDRDKSLELAAKAVDQAKSGGDENDPARKMREFYAQYQLGLIRTKREDWAGAAEAFNRAGELNPGFAYAHYYAGLAYSRVKRPDQVAKHLEMFLKLAPKAPERSAVQSILRSIRGV
jgi:tetratricopeptide (TPR) repeat protein